MSSLNPSLYRALRQFGSVRLASEGERMVAVYEKKPDGRVWMRVINPGEYLVVSCPYCTDTRRRLWINHRWGVRDPHTGTYNYWLAICYNDDCLALEENRLDLIDRLTWYHRDAAAGRVEVAAGRVEPVGRPVPLPRDFVPLDKLRRGHLARNYVRRRGFHPDALAQDWGVGFSSREAFRLSGRLVIPLYRIDETGKSVCWGWQARAIGPNDKHIKYFTSPRLKKSQLLYGLERAGGTQPVLICEGATDVWRAGNNAVALLGKDASDEQIRLIRKHLHGQPLVVALDPDAEEEAEKLVRRLQEARTRSLLRPDDAPVVRLSLSDGRDPADCTREDLWRAAKRVLHQSSSDRPKTKHRPR